MPFQKGKPGRTSTKYYWTQALILLAIIFIKTLLILKLISASILYANHEKRKYHQGFPF